MASTKHSSSNNIPPIAGAFPAAAISSTVSQATRASGEVAPFSSLIALASALREDIHPGIALIEGDVHVEGSHGRTKHVVGEAENRAGGGGWDIDTGAEQVGHCIVTGSS